MARNDLPPPGAANFQQRLRETVMTYLGRQGDKMDRGLTLRDLVEANIIKLRNGFGGGSATGPLPLDPGDALYIEDLTPPPAPTGFTASASTVNVLFETDAPKFRVGNGHLKTVIYGVAYTTGDPLPTFSSAVKVTEFPGNVFSHPLDPGSKWRYWATWVTNDGVEGLPTGGTNGIEATTDLIDDAKIANLSASKIKAGRISVGEYIESASYVPGADGWRINGDGTAFLENAVVRGTVWASAGQIGGITIASSAVRAGQTGFDTGNGFYLGADGQFSLGNGAQRLTWNGSALTIKGNLDGATGTFGGLYTGTLDASQINTGYLSASRIDANTINAGMIVSKSATSFEQASIWLTDDEWTAYSFYMDHAGVATVISTVSKAQSGTGGDWATYLAMGVTSFVTSASGSWYDSAAPTPPPLMISNNLSAGWHTLYMRYHISTFTGQHLGYFTLLRSYR